MLTNIDGLQILTEIFLIIFHCIHAYSINWMIDIKYVHLNYMRIHAV